MFDVLGLCVRVAWVGAGRMSDDRGIELLPKFATQFRNTALGIFRKFLGSGTILNGIDRFASVIFEVAQHALQLFLHFFDFGLLFLLAFGGKARLVAFEFFF